MDEEKNKTEQSEEQTLESEQKETKEECSKEVELDNQVESVEDEQEEEKKENNIENKSTVIKKKRNIIIGSVVFAMLLLGIFSNVFVSKYEKIVYPGVTIYGEDISKLNKEELDKKLNQIESKINNNKICIKANSKSYYISMNDVALGYNINELSNDIINYGKDKNVFSKLSQIIMKSNKDFKFNIEVNNSNIGNLVQEISEETNKAMVEPQVIINGEKISYVEGINGLKIDEKLFNKEVNKVLSSNSIADEVVNIEAQYKLDKPTITISDLKNIDSKISTFSTNYSPGGGRGSNVENAAKKIDNMLLMPGQEFSYEQSVGPVVQSNGYTYAPVISNGEMVQGIGGGVCQVSSTLYNTMLKSGILPTERRNHSKAVNYVPRGLDATLASGSIDYKFKNTLEYPLVINTNCSGGKLTIEFWSNKNALKGIEYKPVSYARGNTANSYLYGYDKNGNKVYEKHIDTSVYR